MKILIVVPSYPKFSGVDFHRIVEPHKVIGKYEGVEVDMINEIDTAEIAFLMQYDFCVVNRFLSKTGDYSSLILKLKKARLRYILDLDDDYVLPPWHILYGAAKQKNHALQIVNAVKSAYAVTTTNERLAAVINAEIGKTKCGIIPNGINPVNQFEARQVEFERPRMGWSGSITHFEDVLLMHDAIKYLYQSESKFTVVHGGYDGTDMTSCAIAGILSAKGIADENSFMTFPATDVLNYGTFYDNINISLIPLRDNRFNSMKSNLKMLEAGFKKKSVIVSHVNPYIGLIEHSWNCLSVKHKNDWYKNMKALIESKDLRETLSEQLYEDVQEYHIDKVAELRYNFYKSIL
jgi:hypothetical protein